MTQMFPLSLSISLPASRASRRLDRHHQGSAVSLMHSVRFARDEQHGCGVGSILSVTYRKSDVLRNDLGETIIPRLAINSSQPRLYVHIASLTSRSNKQALTAGDGGVRKTPPESPHPRHSQSRGYEQTGRCTLFTCFPYLTPLSSTAHPTKDNKRCHHEHPLPTCRSVCPGKY